MNKFNAINKPSRNDVIDGLRGIAILLVVAFHYFADSGMSSEARQLHYPFGEKFINTPIIRHGDLGVQLFFIISGYVIAMTLESCRTPFDFAIKRFSRLFPTMVICSLVTALFLMVLPLKIWHIQWVDFIPGWTFTDEHLWSLWLGRPVGVVDGVYWTLFVEVKFYAIAAMLYFGMSRVPLVFSMGALLVLELILTHTIPGADSDTLKNLMLYESIPYFLAGICFRELSLNRRNFWAFGFLAIAFLISIYRVKSSTEPTIMVLAFYLVFLLLIFEIKIVYALSWKPLVSVGLSSYSLYLLHNRIGVALTHNLGEISPQWIRESLILPFISASILLLISAFIYKYWETWSRNALLHSMSAWRTHTATAANTKK